MVYLLVLLVFPIYKVAVNFERRSRLRSLNEIYEKYVGDHIQDGREPEWTIVQRRQELVDLFKRAGVTDSAFVSPEPIGYGQVHNQKISVCDNIALLDKRVLNSLRLMFSEADGVYTRRIREAYNLVYWIETIIFLPSRVIEYVGVPPTSAISRTANVIGWVLGVAAFFFALPDFTDARDAVSGSLFQIFQLVTGK